MTVAAARAEMELHHKILRESAEFSKAINMYMYGLRLQ